MKLYANPSLSGSPRGGYILRFFQKPNRVFAGSREGSEADRLAHMLFEELYNVDSYICNTDSLACRVRGFLAGQGVTLPRDVQIIGYDGFRTMPPAVIPARPSSSRSRRWRRPR